MSKQEVAEYRKAWQKAHKMRVRMHKLKWYYRNRKMINLMFAKADGSTPDAADLYYAQKHPQG